MRPQDAQAKIRELAAVPCHRHPPNEQEQLDPSRVLDCELVAAKLKEYSRFGLPGGHGDGRGGEAPLPMLGTTDRQILLARDNYQKFLTDAALALEAAMRIQRAWVVPRTDDTEKAKQLAEPVGVACGNVYCHDAATGTPRRITGLQNNRGRKVEGVGPVLCERCYRFSIRTGKMWTPALEQAEAS